VVARIVSRWVIGGALLAGVAVAPPAAAQSPGRPSPTAAAIPPLRLPALPGLTAQQKQQLEQLHQKTQLMLAPMHAALWLREQELNLIWSQGADRDVLLGKLAQMDVIRGRMREILLDQRLSLMAALTPEQKAAFLALAAKAPRTPQKNPVLGLEECMSTGDCVGPVPLGLR
jgi:Spy/CpxP family protein refolding chaperone